MTDYSTLSDEQLVERTLADKEVFFELMQRYEQKLLHYIYRISSASREDAQDILQEVFLKTYTNLQGFSSKNKFSSWIYRITHNETISQFRKKKVRPSIPMEEEDLYTFASELNIASETDTKLEQERIQKVINLLKPKYAEILILYYLEQKSYEEISAILKKPSGTVATQLRRAKKAFESAYKAYEQKH